MPKGLGIQIGEQIKLMKRKKQSRGKCQANTQFCSGEILARYGVNGSEKDGKFFTICGACMVILKRQGAKFKRV